MKKTAFSEKVTVNRVTLSYVIEDMDDLNEFNRVIADDMANSGGDMSIYDDESREPQIIFENDDLFTLWGYKESLDVWTGGFPFNVEVCVWNTAESVFCPAD